MEQNTPPNSQDSVKETQNELDTETIKTLVEMAKEYEHAKWLKKHLFIWVPVLFSFVVMSVQGLEWFVRYLNTNSGK